MADNALPVVSPEYTAKDRATNVVRAIVVGIPYLGPSLEQLLYGKAEELRTRRFEQTLQEIGEQLQQRRLPPPASEEFANLLEEVAKPLTRSTQEDRRKRFRDLLLNASQLAPDDPRWSSANLASKLLAEIDAPGLAILAATSTAERLPNPALVSLPSAQLVDLSAFSWDNPLLGEYPIHYPWPVVEEWAHRLRDMRLYGYGSVDARGGFGAVSLTELGRFLISWTIYE